MFSGSVTDICVMLFLRPKQATLNVGFRAYHNIKLYGHCFHTFKNISYSSNEQIATTDAFISTPGVYPQVYYGGIQFVFEEYSCAPDICCWIRDESPGISKSQRRKQIQLMDKCTLRVTITPNTEIDIKKSNAVEINSGQKTRHGISLNLLIWLS